MNRKIMILMVAVVATVLPAVAVADVMITGFVPGVGQSVPDAFVVQPGSNYMAAHRDAGFTWKSSANNESEDLGNITLGVMSNETIYEINVLDINFTGPGYFNLTVAVPYSTTVLFPAGTYMYYSTSPLNLTTSGIGVGTPSPAVSGSLSLSDKGSTTIDFGHVTSSTHIYLGFIVGSGMPSDGSFNLEMSFTD